MTSVAQILLWTSLGLVCFSYAGYPIAVFVLSRLFGKPPIPPNADAHFPLVSVLVSALNEEKDIAQRIENNLVQDYPTDRLEIVVASDGSVDNTAVIVRSYAERYPGRVRLVEYPQRRGKATVLNDALPNLSGDIVVLSDANTMFAKNAIKNLSRWFSEENIGVVCGKLILVDASSGRNVDGLYWRYETFVKNCEGQLGALLGANGAIYALRRAEYVQIPSDTIIDDFVIPLLIKMTQRKRIVYDIEAIATEATSPKVSDEFKRRSRIGAGGFQSLARLWRLSLPIYGWTSFSFLSHKFLRWVCPFLLIVAFTSNLLLVNDQGYLALLLAQCGFYLASILGGVVPGNSTGARVLRLASMFTTMNVALALGCYRWMTSQQQGTWQRTARS